MLHAQFFDVPHSMSRCFDLHSVLVKTVYNHMYTVAQGMSATSKLQRCPRLDSTKCWRLRSIIFEAVVVTARLLLLLSSLQLSIVYLVCIQYIVCYVAVQQQASKLNLIPSRFLSFIMIDLKAISAASFITKIITQPATSAPNYDYDSRSYSFLVPLAEFDWSLQIWNMMGVVSCAAAVLCYASAGCLLLVILRGAHPAPAHQALNARQK